MTASEASRRRRADVRADARASRGFTLIELLVVMAISVILLGLIFGPMVQAFNLTSRARVQVQVQDTARSVMQRVERELSDAVYVFDNSSTSLIFWVRGQGGGASLPMSMPYSQVDLVPPAHVNDQNPLLNPSVVIDPTTMLPLEALRGPLALPPAPGRVIVRYWLGLRDNRSEDWSGSGGIHSRPVVPYGNVWESVGRGAVLETHNPYILYRAVFSPYTIHGKVDTRFINLSRYGSVQAALSDPNFFYDNDPAVAPTDPSIGSNAAPGWRDLNGDGVVNISENWRAVARPMVDAEKADLVQVERGPDRVPLYDASSGAVRMRISPLVRFQPSYVGNDAGAAGSASDPANEAPRVPPVSQSESYGHWVTPFRVYVYRSSLSAPVLTYFLWTGVGNVRYIEYDTASGTVTNGGGAGDDTGFDPLNPTSLPAAPVDGRFLMFTVDPRKGTVNFGFPHSITQQGADQQVVFDPAVANGEFSYVASLPGMQLNSFRYLSLLPLNSASNPAGVDPALNGGYGSPLSLPAARMVSGSEVVTGPDMRVGPHYGLPIEYTRAPRSTPASQLGPNEYSVNYSKAAGLDPVAVADPRADAMQRAVLGAGTLIFPSRVNVPGVVTEMPSGTDSAGNPIRIRVRYQIQNNLYGDVVKADYLTRQLMTFSLGVRMYEIASGQPQQVSLTQKLRIRNLQR